MRIIPRLRTENNSILIILLAFSIILNAPDIAELRRPFHDSVGTFYYRIFSTDAIKNGSIPYFFPYFMQSISFTNLEASLNWSPLGIIIGLFRQYDLLSWAIEGWISSILCLAGMYLFARKHGLAEWSATGAAISYAGSGLIIGTMGTVATPRALQVAPWIFYAIERIIELKTLRTREWLAAASMLAIAGACWVTSGYPGIWLTSPLLLAPYMMLRLGLSASKWRVALTTVTLAVILVAAILGILIDGSLNTPMFGSAGARIKISPWDGVFQAKTAIFVLAPDPVYLRDPNASGNEPLYFGFIPILSLFLVRPRTRHREISDIVNKLVQILSISCICLATILQFIDQTQNGWLTLSIALVIVIHSTNMTRVVTKAEGGLWVTIAVGLICATDNQLSNNLREHVFPFSELRWNSWYIWVSIICTVIICWKNLEFVSQEITIKGLEPLPKFSFLSSSLILFILGFGQLQRADAQELLQIHKLSSIYVLGVTLSSIIVLIFTYLLMIRNRTTSLSGATWAAIVVMISSMLVVISVRYVRDIDYEVQSKWVIPNYGLFALDMLQVNLVVLAGAVVVGARSKLEIPDILPFMVLLTMIDVGIASSRYLTNKEYFIVGQISAPENVDRSFSFQGNERNLGFSDSCAASAWVLSLSKVPSLTIPCGLKHAMSTAELGTMKSKQREIVISHLDEKNECDRSLKLAGANSIATIVKWLPDYMLISIEQKCTSIIEVRDVWAAGWSVAVDGYPSEVIRSEDNTRMVLVPSGIHSIEWKFRPKNGSVLFIIGLVSLVFCTMNIVYDMRIAASLL